jgi:cbb3-type cytochrome oxidase subunit 3
MARRTKIAVIGLIIVLIIVVVWILSGKGAAGKGQQQNNPVTYTNWDEEYLLSSKEPKGMFHWNMLLRKHLKKKSTISSIDYFYSIDTIPSTAKPTFMFVGDFFVLHQEEINAVMKRVQNGAKLFISHEKMDGLIHQLFFDSIRQGFLFDTSLVVATPSQTYAFTHRYQSLPLACNWYGYKDIVMRDSLPMDTLSGFGDLLNNAVIQYGEGEVYLNTTPELFMNYQLLTKDGFGLSKIWLNAIPKNESVYWLELGRYVSKDSNYEEDLMQDEGEVDDSYLQFIFQDRIRIIALSLLFVGALLFVLFRAKRMQPVVPVIAKKRNMTLIFADTITSIYFNQRNPYSMVKMQQSNFYGLVQKNFNIDLSKEITEKDLISLSQKCNVRIEEIQNILKQLKSKNEQSCTENDLVEIRKLMLNFYHQSGIIKSHIKERLDMKNQTVYRNEWITALFLLAGMILIVIGFYYLTKAIGVGVLLWPIGMIPIIIGMLRLMKPYLIWTNHTLQIRPLIGKERTHQMEDLQSVYQGGQQVQLQFKQAIVKLYNWELNRSDRKRFRIFIDNHNKLK